MHLPADISQTMLYDFITNVLRSYAMVLRYQGHDALLQVRSACLHCNYTYAHAKLAKRTSKMSVYFAAI